MTLIGLVSISSTAVGHMDERGRVAEHTDNQIGLASFGLTEVTTLEFLSESSLDKLIDKSIAESR